MTAAARTTSAPLRDPRARRFLVVCALVFAVLVAVVLSVTVGAKPVSVGEVWHALWDPADGESDIIVRGLRVPRTVLGLLTGLALGVAGALTQGHTRNPLADPGLLGVTQGASFAMVLSIVLLRLDGVYGYIWFGLAGALIAGAAVFALSLADGPGGPAPVTLALAGTAVSALLYALTSTIVLLDKQAMDVFRFWQVGSIAGRDSAVTGQVLPFVVAGLLLAFANAPGLNALALGEDVARGLGQRIALTRTVGLAAITLLTGAAVAACGALAFLGLIVPHLARALSGPDHRWLLPYSGLAGAALLLIADVLGRVVARPGELEAGVVLALLGAPFFVALVRRGRTARL